MGRSSHSPTNTHTHLVGRVPTLFLSAFLAKITLLDMRLCVEEEGSVGEMLNVWIH